MVHQECHDTVIKHQNMKEASMLCRKGEMYGYQTDDREYRRED